MDRKEGIAVPPFWAGEMGPHLTQIYNIAWAEGLLDNSRIRQLADMDDSRTGHLAD